ncbi:5'-AMP-activated protein kinase subunit gamma-1 [Durusdinium trenchii]|uniref:5'-AMP-activated protein kinase subunit gamma-1 n=1 Tax=Durusdinium trenchii TaxID=1381693 RepID=A0ABP0M654_9DINO
MYLQEDVEAGRKSKPGTSPFRSTTQREAEARLANLPEERKRKKFLEDFRRREERFQRCQQSGADYKATRSKFFSSFTKGFRRSNYDALVSERGLVKDLPLPRELVTLSATKDGLFSAIQVLTDHHLLSAPVVDRDGKFLGILDTLDIAVHVVEMEAAGKKSFMDERLEKVMGRSARAKPSECSEEDNLQQVVESIVGAARRAVVLCEGKPQSIITQSTIIMFLQSKAKELEVLTMSKTAKDVCTPHVITIDDQATALTAFQTLVAQGVSSLAITDEAGNAITVVSATDLVVALGHEENKSAVLADLRERNVVFFVGDSRKPNKKFSHTRAPIISTSSDVPLIQVIEKFATTRVHRMLVMPQGSRKPEGVVSLVDISRALTRSDPSFSV